MNPNQTAPEGAVCSAFILFAIKTIKINQLMREQTAFIMLGKVLKYPTTFF